MTFALWWRKPIVLNIPWLLGYGNHILHSPTVAQFFPIKVIHALFTETVFALGYGYYQLLLVC